MTMITQSMMAYQKPLPNLLLLKHLDSQITPETGFPQDQSSMKSLRAV